MSDYNFTDGSSVTCKGTDNCANITTPAPIFLRQTRYNASRNRTPSGTIRRAVPAEHKCSPRNSWDYDRIFWDYDRKDGDYTFLFKDNAGRGRRRHARKACNRRISNRSRPFV